MPSVQYSKVAQDEGEKASGKSRGPRGDDDDASLNKRMPFCIGMCVHAPPLESAACLRSVARELSV